MIDDGIEGLVLLVVITGPLALVVSTGWQVAWLIALGIVALVRRQGDRWRGLATPSSAPQGPGAA